MSDRIPYEDRIDLTAQTAEICRILGLDPKYVARLDIEPDKAVVTTYLGKQGRFKGPKVVDGNTGTIATQYEEFAVRA